MDRHANPKLTSSLTTAIVLGAGAIVAMVVAAAPAGMLGPLVETSGLPKLVPAAAPPLGTTARTLLALAIGGAVSTLLWAGLRFIPRHVSLPGRDVLKWLRPVARETVEPDAVPVLRRADAHPDAPARRPIHASVDLGTPLPIARPGRVEVTSSSYGPLDAPRDQPLPADLDQPLAAFDPDAIPDAPMTPVRPVAPLAVAPLTIVPPKPRVEPAVVKPEPAAQRRPSQAHLFEVQPSEVHLFEVQPSEVQPSEVQPPEIQRVALAPVKAVESILRVVLAPTSSEPEPEPDSLAALVARLERATQTRETPAGAKSAVVPPPAAVQADSIEDTLGMLRRLAAG